MRAANHSEVAHLWANQAASEIHCGGNVFSEGDTIYSYGWHFPIARHYPKQKVVLFTSEDYSASTSKHKSIVRSALCGQVVIEVPSVNVVGPSPHRDNLDYFAQTMAGLVGAAKRARKYTDSLLASARLKYADFRLYVDSFHLKSKLPAALRRVYDAGELDVSSLEAQAAAQRKARQAQAKRDAKKREAARKAQAQRDQERLQQWLAGEATTVPYGISKVYCRVLNGEPRRIETSKGAIVGLLAAKLVWRVASECKAAHMSREFSNVKIDHYTLNRCDEYGNVSIGCHFIEFDEIDRIGQLLGWQ